MVLDRESRITAAKARIKELELLIKAWTSNAPGLADLKAMQGLKITESDLKRMREVTEKELEEYFSLK
tara:strand:+ start:855 stop:1058 length:204 start_codon:yes stop_codon:yes gene_type:complete